MRTDNPQWQQPWPQWPGLTQIHLVAFPLSTTISLQVQSRYAKLSQHGPNDGVVLLKDCLRMPGAIYPIWGTDHMMRTPIMGSLFHKLCYFIHHQRYKDLNDEKSDHSLFSVID